METARSTTHGAPRSWRSWRGDGAEKVMRTVFRWYLAGAAWALARQSARQDEGVGSGTLSHPTIRLLSCTTTLHCSAQSQRSNDSRGEGQEEAQVGGGNAGGCASPSITACCCRCAHRCGSLGCSICAPKPREGYDKYWSMLCPASGGAVDSQYRSTSILVGCY